MIAINLIFVLYYCLRGIYFFLFYNGLLCGRFSRNQKDKIVEISNKAKEKMKLKKEKEEQDHKKHLKNLEERELTQKLKENMFQLKL